MTKKERDEANDKTGSSFNLPLANFHAFKQNGGLFHSSQGHTTHFTDLIMGAINEHRQDCAWQGRLRELKR